MPTELPTGTPAVLALDDIKPYWRNPRRISEEAVNALAMSISEYDYQQPIVVDSDHVIIVGHTRYSALRRLGVEQVGVIVADHLTEQQAAEWRVVDNRTGEYSSWDFDALDTELSTLGERVVSFFPEMREFDPPTDTGIDVLVAYEEAAPPEDDSVELVCPSCFHTWETPVTLSDLQAGHIGPNPEEKS